ncbi:hypothetical protein HPB51_001044 [Rhipicephalus microplus]|uniref:ISXO2-like transposase domain-containing protein n=1 Tax=Rhipicephalus microplus TaxID=6941 RepID=A0A9J6DLA9_RHIMP|nr:hypothetical protein HPB51_001044 [Rhipicephalus microplus]
MATPRIDPSIVEIADIINYPAAEEAKHILPRTTVYSDEWAAYQCIPRLVKANGTPLNLDWHTVNTVSTSLILRQAPTRKGLKVNGKRPSAVSCATATRRLPHLCRLTSPGFGGNQLTHVPT